MTTKREAQEKRTFGLRFGAMSPPVREQLREQGLTADRSVVAQVQADADAIVRLHIRGLLPDGQAKVARSRLMKALGKEVRARLAGRQG